MTTDSEPYAELGREIYSAATSYTPHGIRQALKVVLPSRMEEAARKVNERNRQRGHVLVAYDGTWADVMPTDEIVSILQSVFGSGGGR